MREIWLRPNRRAILFGCVPPLILALSGGWLMYAFRRREGFVWFGLGVLLTFLGTIAIAVLLAHLKRPRIAFENNQVLFGLRRGAPIAVPVDIVESFFAGQSPALLPGLVRQPQTVNLIARLSQRHSEWAEQDVKLALGQWREGYVTIRGTWCEPLSTEVIRRLNRRLHEVKNATKRVPS